MTFPIKSYDLAHDWRRETGETAALVSRVFRGLVALRSGVRALPLLNLKKEKLLPVYS